MNTTKALICNMEGKTKRYNELPSIENAKADFVKEGYTTLFYLKGGETSLETFENIDTNETEIRIFSVYENDFFSLIKRRIPLSILDLFGGYENICSFPYLEWNDRFLGGTDYIDGIRYNDLGKHSIMIGKDKSNRIFLVFKLINNENKKWTQTLFQRYPDRLDDNGDWPVGNTWAFANGILSGCLHADNIKYMNKLFSENGFDNYRDDCNWKAQKETEN